MNRKIETLQTIYNNEIRKKCEVNRLKIKKCFHEYTFEPENNCKHFIDSFQQCINKFNDEFHYKYSKIAKFTIHQ